MKKALLFSISALLSPILWADCGAQEAQCYHYQDGELQSETLCTVEICVAPDGDSYSEWTWHDGSHKVTLYAYADGTEKLSVDDEPAERVSPPEGDETLECYDIIDDDEMVCKAM